MKCSNDVSTMLLISFWSGLTLIAISGITWLFIVVFLMLPYVVYKGIKMGKRLGAFGVKAMCEELEKEEQNK